jgi:site-specific DNA recombinase
MDFAVYGRVSTEDNQDPESSRAWQLSRATALVEPRSGRIVAEYFDIGLSRSLPWQRRPEASALLTALRDPSRGFDAVVIGEPHRAFYGNQFGMTLPLFSQFGVQLWVPEIGGPIDPDNEAHELVMSVFGGVSKGERNRIRVRVRTAMASQTELERRYLGGRPPYGYQLQDLGPHPNPAKAADGRRLRGLTPDPAAANVVRRIFDEFLAGNGIFGIAQGLTRDGIPCPSAHDRERNSHRSGTAWSKSAVRVILTNPRYTGRQVWNRQRTDEVLLDIDDVARGHVAVMRWNDRSNWIRSKEIAHAPLIDDETFERAQVLLAGRTRGPNALRRRGPTRNPYVFRGLLHCGLCERKMQGQWSHDTAYYRCRYPREYAVANDVDHPKSVILREDRLLGPLDSWLATALAPPQLAATITAMTDTQEQVAAECVHIARSRIAAADAKLSKYRAALDAGADPSVVTSWIAEAHAERLAARALLQEHTRTSADRLSRDQIVDLVDYLGDIAAVLTDADPRRKAEIYRELGIRLTYQPKERTVRAEAHLDGSRWHEVGVRGGIRTRVPSTPAGSGCVSWFEGRFGRPGVQLLGWRVGVCAHARRWCRCRHRGGAPQRASSMASRGRADRRPAQDDLPGLLAVTQT